MTSLPHCPACNSVYAYTDDTNFICPECAHDWPQAAPTDPENDAPGIRDANSTLVANGDTVTVIKDRKIRGTSSVVKVGTKVKNSAWSTTPTATSGTSRTSAP